MELRENLCRVENKPENRSPTKCLNWHVFELVCETSTLKGYFQPSEAVNIDFPLIWRQTLMMGLLFHVISIFFFTACTLQNSHVEALAHGKIKSGRKSLVKKKWKRNLDQRRKKERVPFCQEKKKISSWQRPVLAELCAGVQVSNIEVAVKPKFATHNVKKEVPFLYTSTSLIHKH